MGRKIPGRKHHGVRDPEKQKKERFERLRSKLDNPPKKPDDQEVPKSALKLMTLKEKAKRPVKKRKREKKPLLSLEKFLDKEEILPGMTKPDKFIPNLVQKPNEKPERFLNRIHWVSQNILNEVQFEEQYKVDIKRDPKTGKVIQVQKQKPDPNDPATQKMSKKKKLSVKKKEKKLAKKEIDSNVKDFNNFTDKVEYGEVVHRPPNKLPPLKKAELLDLSKKRNLLLYDLLKKTNDKSKNKLSAMEKERQEKERQHIVEAYRKFKNNRMNIVK